MATKTISIETDAYELLLREKRDPKESFSRVIRRLFAERPTLTAGELLDAMQSFEGWEKMMLGSPATALAYDATLGAVIRPSAVCRDSII